VPPESLSVVAPLYVLMPDKVNVPVPVFVNAPVSEPSEITPAKVVLGVPPAVSVPEPSVIAASASLVVDVAIDATVSLNPARLNVALLLTTTADELEIRSAAPSATVPADTVVVPVYVLLPDNVNVPAPDFARPPDVVAIAPLIVEVPTESTVSVYVFPVKPPDNVKDEPVSICTSDAANIVTAPEIVFVPLVLRIAPTSADDSVTPSPLTSIGSATVTPFEIDNVASFATVVLPRVLPLSPSAVLLLIATTPVEIVVLPVYVLAFDNVNVLLVDEFFVTPPAPEITPDKLCVADDAKVNVLPEAIEMPPEYVAGDVPPKVPAVATVNTPAEITVSPE
jgi:hypothetical protein